MREKVIRAYRKLIERKNEKQPFYNGIYDRWKYPVLTREHIPPNGDTIFPKRTIRILWKGWA